MITYEEFVRTLEHEPTDEQRKVIVSEDHAIAVIAGAGSGKTATMAQRIVWHIVNGNVRPEEVLGLTFTTKAAGELANRVESQLQKAAEEGLMPHTDPPEDHKAADPSGADQQELSDGGQPAEGVRTADTARPAEEGQPADGVRLADGVHHSDTDVAPYRPTAGLLQVLTGDADEDLGERAQVNSGVGEELADRDLKASRVHAQTAQPTIATYNSFAAEIASSYSMLIGEDPRARLITDAERWQIMRDIVARIDTDSTAFEALKGWSASTVISRALGLSDHLISHGATTNELRKALDKERSAVMKVRDVNVPKGAHTPQSRAQSDVPAKAQVAIDRRIALCSVIDAYHAYKKDKSVIEFADQVDRANRILKAAPDQVSELVGNYKLILLDEYQDTSTQQAEFLYNAFSEAWSVCAVGDPNQAIYSWRGASAAALSDFMDRFRVAKNLTLSTAFRNSWKILDAANALTQGKLSYPSITVKELVPRNGVGEGDVRFIHRTMRADSYAAMANEFAHLFDEARAEIEEKLARGEKKQDTPAFPTAVVLCRARSYMGHAARALEERGVPYEIVGGEALIEKPEVRLVRSFLGLVAVPDRNDLLVPIFTHFAVGAKDLVALADYAKELARAAEQEAKAKSELPGGLDNSPKGRNAPTGGDKSGGSAEAKAAGKLAVDVRPSLVEAIDALPNVQLEEMTATGRERLLRIRSLLRSVRERLHLAIPDLITHTIDALDLPLYARARRDGGSRVESALGAFVRMAAQYVGDNPRATLQGFVQWVDAVEEHEHTGEGDFSEDVPLLISEDVVPESGVVQIMTIHAAKGLEWDLVAIPEMKYGGFDDLSRDTAWQLDASALPFPLRADKAHMPAFNFADVIPESATVQPAEKVPILEMFNSYVTGSLRKHYAAEQRRLAYVAVTRPKNKLILCSYDLVDETKAALALRKLAREVNDGGGDTSAAEATMPQNSFISDLAGLVTPAPDNDPILTGSDLQMIAQRTQSEGADPWATIFDPATKRWPTDTDRRLDRVANVPTRNVAKEELSQIIARWKEEARALINEAGSAPVRTVLSRDYLTASDVVRLSADPDGFVRDQRRPVPSPPSRAARRGTLVHAEIAHHFNAPSTLDVDAVAHPDAMPIDMESQLTDSRRAELLRRFSESVFAGCAPLGIEDAIDVRVGEWPIRCVIDAVLDTSKLPGHPPVTIVDWKTGRRPADADISSRELQLGLYRLAWSAATGTDISDVGACFYYLGEDNPGRRELRAGDLTADQIAAQISEQLEKGAATL